MKTLFLGIPVGVNVRNILRLGPITVLRDGGVRVVCFTPEARDSEVVAEFERDGLILRDLPPYVPPSSVRHVRRLERFAFFASKEIETIDIKKKRAPIRKAIAEYLYPMVKEFRQPAYRARWKLVLHRITVKYLRKSPQTSFKELRFTQTPLYSLASNTVSPPLDRPAVSDQPKRSRQSSFATLSGSIIRPVHHSGSLPALWSSR